MMGRRLACFAAAGLAAIGLTAGAAHGLVIDDFTEGPISLSSEGSELSDGISETQTDLDSDRVLGGERYLFLSVVTSEPIETPATLAIAPEASEGRFRFDAAVNDDPDTRTSSYFTLRYGSDDEPLGLDATQHGDAFKLHNVVTNFHEVATLPIRIWVVGEQGGGRADLEFETDGETHDLIIPFSSFGNADFENVTRIEISAVRSEEEGFLTFDGFTVIPEPTSLALLGLGGLAMLMRRRPSRGIPSPPVGRQECRAAFMAAIITGRQRKACRMQLRRWIDTDLTLLFVAGLAALLLARPAQSDVMLEFEDLPAGTTFPTTSLPTSFVSDGTTIELTAYNGSTGANARITDFNATGSTGNALALFGNVRAEVDLGAGATGGYFYFAGHGGTNLLEVNGATVDLRTLMAERQGSLGSVNFHANPGPDSGWVSQLDGEIDSLAFIGQELVVDRVTLTIIPEPASLALLGVGGLAMLMRRRTITS